MEWNGMETALITFQFSDATFSNIWAKFENAENLLFFLNHNKACFHDHHVRFYHILTWKQGQKWPAPSMQQK